MRRLNVFVALVSLGACGKTADPRAAEQQGPGVRGPADPGSAALPGTTSPCADKLDALAKLFETQVAAEEGAPLPNGFDEMTESGGLVTIEYPPGNARDVDYLSIGKKSASVTAPSGVTEDVDLRIEKVWPVKAKTLAIAPAADAPWRSVEAALRRAAKSYDGIAIVYRTDLAFAHRPKPRLASGQSFVDWFESVVAELRAHCPAMAEALTSDDAPHDPHDVLKQLAPLVRGCTCGTDANAILGLLATHRQPTIALVQVGAPGAAKRPVANERATWGEVVRASGTEPLPLSLPAANGPRDR